MIRPPWLEPDWDVMEEAVQVTLIVDIFGLQEWALAVCPWSDWAASAWKGAALMAKVLNDKWGREFTVSFTKWAGDTVAEIYYPTGGRDADDDEQSLLDDVKDRTDRAAFSALEDGEWILAAEPCVGIWQVHQGKAGTTRLLYDTQATREQAERCLEEIIERRQRLHLQPDVYAWLIEPMPMAVRVAR